VKEVESLEAVLDMRNQEIRSLRADLINYKSTVNELKDLQETVRSLHANKEDLLAQIDKNRKDKALLQEKIQSLESNLMSTEADKLDICSKYEQLYFKYQSRNKGEDTLEGNKNTVFDFKM